MIRPDRSLPYLATLVFSLTFAGCVDGYVEEYRQSRQSDEGESSASTPSENPGNRPSEFARKVRAMVQDFPNDNFETLTSEPFPSSAASGRDIRLHVSQKGVAGYLASTAERAPGEDSGSMPRGSIVVREILDESGDVEKWTLVAQRKEAFHPQVDGLWFGVMNPDGTYKTIDGEPKAGALGGCASCHTSRRDSDYLFGVPSDFLAVERVAETDAQGDSGDDDATVGDEGPASENSGPADEDSSDSDDTDRRSLDLSGYRLVNREEELSEPQSARLPEGANIEADELLVAARDSTEREFETYWDVELGEEVTFVNMQNTSPFGAPIVNGGERWSLLAPSGHRVAGPTRPGLTHRTHERTAFTGDPHIDWGVARQHHATPGTSRIEVRDESAPDLFVSEWSDAAEHEMEFIEIRWSPGR